jgi:hypothetical protein
MRFKRVLAAATASAVTAAGVVAAVAVSAGSAAAGTITADVALPLPTYSQMLVDPIHHHLFVTAGSGSSSILVTDYSGQTVATIPNEPGATGLALSDDGSTVYAALAHGDAISAISTTTLAETARYATGTGTDPAYVAYTSGRIWFGYGAPGSHGAIGSIDPSTSPAAVTLSAVNDPLASWYGAPKLKASPAGDLVAGQPSSTPLQLASYDVSTGTAARLTPMTTFNNYAFLTGMQITPDGKDVVVATTATAPTIFQVSDLSVVGGYPAANSAGGVAIAGDGTVAAGSGTSNSYQVSLFAPGGTTPLDTYSFGSRALVDLALSPDASELFAVTVSVTVTPPSGGRPPTVVRHYALTIITNPVQNPSTITLTGPGTVKHGTPVTLTGTLGTLGGPASFTGGQTLTVTRTDPAEPDGVALPDVTTAADGSFSITDTPPKLHANQGTVTYQVSYAGDAHLTASAATVSVTVQPGNG